MALGLDEGWDDDEDLGADDAESDGDAGVDDGATDGVAEVNGHPGADSPSEDSTVADTQGYASEDLSGVASEVPAEGPGQTAD